MKKATICDLRYSFREAENLLREGEEIEITKRVIARSSRVAAPSTQTVNRVARCHRKNDHGVGLRLGVHPDRVTTQFRWSVPGRPA